MVLSVVGGCGGVCVGVLAPLVLFRTGAWQQLERRCVQAPARKMPQPLESSTWVFAASSVQEASKVDSP
eukprot:6182618-Alexandrium_andersonii.AAC.1